MLSADSAYAPGLGNYDPPIKYFPYLQLPAKTIERCLDTVIADVIHTDLGKEKILF
jgi:hypothetical protein